MDPVDSILDCRRKFRRLLLGIFRPTLLSAEGARASLKEDLEKHWDPSPIDLYELVLEEWEPDKIDSSQRFIVFIDCQFDVDWIADRPTPPDSAACISNADSIGARRCRHLPLAQILEFKHLVGQAIVHGLRGQQDESRKLANDAARYLKERTVERSRMWTLLSAHLLLVSTVLAFLLNAHLKTIALSPNTFPATWLWLSLIGGIIGAYCSVLQKAGRGEWDAAAGFGLHLLEVFTKIASGALFGSMAFVLSRSVHAPVSLTDLVSDGYSVLVLGFAAGFLERLVPKMVSSYSQGLANQSKL